MTTEFTSREAVDQGEEEAPQPVALPSFREALDQTPIFKNEHESGEKARELMRFHAELRASDPTLEDVKMCDLGSPERAILLEAYARNNLHRFIDVPPPEHQTRPLAIEVEPEPEPQTTYYEELAVIKAAPTGDRVRLIAKLFQRRGTFSPSG